MHHWVLDVSLPQNFINYWLMQNIFPDYENDAALADFTVPVKAVIETREFWITMFTAKVESLIKRLRYGRVGCKTRANNDNTWSRSWLQKSHFSAVSRLSCQKAAGYMALCFSMTTPALPICQLARTRRATWRSQHCLVGNGALLSPFYCTSTTYPTTGV